MKLDSPKLVGLFAGVGGIELGFQRAGFSPILANEIDEKASITYRLNHSHSLLTEDVKLISAKSLPKFDVLTGGFPCQAFSVAGYQKGFKDPRGNVFWEIVRILDSKKPEIVFLENVKNLTTHDFGRTFSIIIEALHSVGYHVKYEVLNADKYGGVPQNRERIYIVGFRSKKYNDRFDFPAQVKKRLPLDNLIDFDTKVEDIYYYENRYMVKELKKHIKRKDTVYQWRRQYVRENKSGVCPTLTANMGTGGHNVPLILSEFGIRKLTPKECFNLMGFPKSFKLPKDLAISHLYKQAGNSVVVPVIERIAKNIYASINGLDLPSVSEVKQLSWVD